MTVDEQSADAAAMMATTAAAWLGTLWLAGGRIRTVPDVVVDAKAVRVRPVALAAIVEGVGDADSTMTEQAAAGAIAPMADIVAAAAYLLAADTPRSLRILAPDPGPLTLAGYLSTTTTPDSLARCAMLAAGVKAMELGPSRHLVDAIGRTYAEWGFHPDAGAIALREARERGMPMAWRHMNATPR